MNGEHEKGGVPKYETLPPDEKKHINKAVDELVKNGFIEANDEAAKREIRYQIGEIAPGQSEKLKGPLLGKDGKPVIARMDEKGGGVNLTFGGVEEREN